MIPLRQTTTHGCVVACKVKGESAQPLLVWITNCAHAGLTVTHFVASLCVHTGFFVTWSNPDGEHLLPHCPCRQTSSGFSSWKKGSPVHWRLQGPQARERRADKHSTHVISFAVDYILFGTGFVKDEWSPAEQHIPFLHCFGGGARKACSICSISSLGQVTHDCAPWTGESTILPVVNKHLFSCSILCFMAFHPVQ